MTLGSNHTGAILNVFILKKILCMCVSWCANSMTVRNTQCNDENSRYLYSKRTIEALAPVVGSLEQLCISREAVPQE